MASTVEIMNCLEKLSTAYPVVETTQETLDLYVEMLTKLPGYVLKRSVEEYSMEANWFPKIAELRHAAAKVAGTSSFWELPETLVGSPRGEAVRLENLFFREGVLEKTEWMTLAKQFEDMGREHGAERERQKLKAYQEIAERECNKTR